MRRATTPLLTLLTATALASTTAQAQSSQSSRQLDPVTKASPDGQSFLVTDEATRRLARTAAQETLLEVSMLRHNAHQAHWDVLGEDFYELHPLPAALRRP